MKQYTKEQAVEALEKSIKHWKEDVLERVQNGQAPIISAPSCACCNLAKTFRAGPLYSSPTNKFTECFEACPIADYVGDTHCSSTPYEDADWVYDSYEKDDEDYEELVKHINEEIAFLTKVLEHVKKEE